MTCNLSIKVNALEYLKIDRETHHPESGIFDTTLILFPHSAIYSSNSFKQSSSMIPISLIFSGEK
jgi:hypothetical protein